MTLNPNLSVHDASQSVPQVFQYSFAEQRDVGQNCCGTHSFVLSSRINPTLQEHFGIHKDIQSGGACLFWHVTSHPLPQVFQNSFS